MSETIHAIPTLPVARARTLALLLQPEVALTQVAAVAEADPALTATLLRATNSAFSSPAVPIVRVADALVRLGIDDSSVAILATLLHDTATSGLERAGIDLDALWRHTIAVALLTEAARRVADVHAEARGIGFTTGVLHVVGRLVLASQHPRRHARVVELAREGMSLWAADISQFGVGHAAFGGGVAIAWGLPPVIARAIAAQDAGGEPLAEALRTARTLACALGIGDGLRATPSITYDPSRAGAEAVRAAGRAGGAAAPRRVGPGRARRLVRAAPPVLDRLGQVHRLDRLGAGEVGDRARHLQHAVERPRG